VLNLIENYDMQLRLKSAISAHQQNNYEDAHRLYTEILSEQPNHPDANHNIGIILAHRSRTDKAIPYFYRAVESNYTIQQFWKSLITALVNEHRLPEAEIMIERISKFDSLKDLYSQFSNSYSEYLAKLEGGHDTAKLYKVAQNLKALGHYQRAVKFLEIIKNKKISISPLLVNLTDQDFLSKN